MQLVGFALVMFMEDKGLALTITFLLVGLWWVGFAQITLNSLPISPKSERKAKKHVLVNGFHELAQSYMAHPLTTFFEAVCMVINNKE